MTRFAFAALVLAACGGDDGNNAQTDAAVQQMDAASKVTALATCPATVAVTMTTGASAFLPMMDTTISVGDVVKFEATVGHTVVPNTLKPTDSAINVGQNMTKCFKFNVAGTYNIACGIHSYPGSITVN